MGICYIEYMQGTPESVLYVRNGEWNTSQMRNASLELTFSTGHVLERVIKPRAGDALPDSDPLQLTRSLRIKLSPLQNHLAPLVMRGWNINEARVHNFPVIDTPY